MCRVRSEPGGRRARSREGAVFGEVVRRRACLQGYLAHTKQRPPRTAPLGPYSRTMPRAPWLVLGGGAVSYERGFPVHGAWDWGWPGRRGLFRLADVRVGHLWRDKWTALRVVHLRRSTCHAISRPLSGCTPHHALRPFCVL